MPILGAIGNPLDLGARFGTAGTSPVLSFMSAFLTFGIHARQPQGYIRPEVSSVLLRMEIGLYNKGIILRHICGRAGFAVGLASMNLRLLGEKMYECTHRGCQ